MSARLQSFLVTHGISRAEVAVLLDVSESAVSRRLTGATRFTVDEVNKLLPFLTERVGRVVEFEEVFAPEGEPAAEVAQ